METNDVDVGEKELVIDAKWTRDGHVSVNERDNCSATYSSSRSKHSLSALDVLKPPP